MNPLALDLNKTICSVNPIVYEMLSELGKRIYFPSNGILSQAADAKKYAKRFNATIGTALENGEAMHLDCVMSSLSDMTPNEVLLYAPSSGLLDLRKGWQKKELYDNPKLEGKGCSLPIVTSGLSHALSLVSDLFVDPNDLILIPTMNWDNYYLNLFDRCRANIQYFNFFKEGGFDLDAYKEALDGVPVGGKVVSLLNFPNNPSGYTPTETEGEQIAASLIATAERGVNVVSIIDDAYYGLFFEKNLLTQSLFCKIADKHPRLMAIKADAATKEAYVWGLRVGFVTFSIGGVPSGSPLYKALEQKAAGVIRSTISNCSALSQRVILKAITNPDFFTQRTAKAEIMKERAFKVKEVLQKGQYDSEFKAYPFNSGYFMCLCIKNVNAEKLRQHLLHEYGIGTIAITDTNLRIAFSCIEKEQIAELFSLIFKACKDLTA